MSASLVRFNRVARSLGVAQMKSFHSRAFVLSETGKTAEVSWQFIEPENCVSLIVTTIDYDDVSYNIIDLCHRSDLYLL